VKLYRKIYVPNDDKADTLLPAIVGVEGPLTKAHVPPAGEGLSVVVVAPHPTLMLAPAFTTGLDVTVTVISLKDVHEPRVIVQRRV
jgi:hypothetical protein